MTQPSKASGTWRGATYISADSHVTEPVDLYRQRVDAQYRERVPWIEEGDGGKRTIHMEGSRPRSLMTAAVLEKAVVGGWDLDVRRRDQRRDGVAAEVVFPTWALLACFAPEDPGLQLALCRAYNDWAAEVLGGRPERLVAVGLIPMIDVEAAVAEAQRVAGLGMRALFLPAQVPTRPYNDPAYDRFWAAVCDLDLPLTFHSGTGVEPRVVRGPGGAVINYLLGAQLDGPRVMLSLAAGGALDRFPKLRAVTVETGASWLAWVMTQADEIYEAHHMWTRPKLSLKPSELIRRQCAATFMHDPVAVANRGATGIDTLMWGNDYPHPEGTWPHSQARCAEQFEGVPDDELAAIVGGNAARVFGFDL